MDLQILYGGFADFMHNRECDCACVCFGQHDQNDYRFFVHQPYAIVYHQCMTALQCTATLSRFADCKSARKSRQ